MTKTEFLEILNVQASHIIVDRHIKEKYGRVFISGNTDLYLHLDHNFFMQVIEMLEHIVVTFNPNWNDGDSDYLEGYFYYELAGHKFKIMALIPKTKEDE